MLQSRSWPSGSRLIRILFIGVIFGLTIGAGQFSMTKALDGSLLSFRFDNAPRAASGNVVFLAIDKQTLDDVGIWPWPRSRYAALLDKLAAIGVGDVFIDVDFSTPSTPSEDQRLSVALRESGGGTILPVFRQLQSSDEQSQTVVTQPLAMFADNAWLAFANVAMEEDRTVRRFEFGHPFLGQQTQSVAAVLSKSPLDEGSALIDYSINPATVPTISLAEVFRENFDGERLKGRSIVIGAYATELKDIFPVPVYGQLAGPMLHILAAETMLQQRLLKEFHQLPMELALDALIIAAALALSRFSLAIPIVLGAGLLALIEAVAFIAQRDFGIVLYTAKVWMIVGLGLALSMSEKVDWSQFLTDLANAEQRSIRRLLRKIVADSTDAVLAFDHRFKIFEASDSAPMMLAGDDADYRGKPLAEAIPSALYDLVLRLAADHDRQPDAVHSGVQRFSIDVKRMVRHLEATVTISPLDRPKEELDKNPHAFIGSVVIRDTTSRQLYEDRLQYLSSHDDLTGLMNRRAFSQYLTQDRGDIYVAVIGLSRFSVINATMGRHVGDDLLRGTANRLEGDRRILAASRLGGDVFAVAVPSVLFPAPEACAQALIGLFDRPVEVAGRKFHLTVQVGICAHEMGEESGATVERAEHALDTTRDTAGSGWRQYEPEAAARQHHSRMLEASMRDSLQQDQFFLLYQPQVDLLSGALTGAEALLRWQHPDLGLVSPASFIPVAEASGFICDLGRWALTEACREAARWPDHLGVAVNVAPLQMLQGDLVADVTQALALSGLAPSRLTLEVTESAFVDQVSGVVVILDDLRRLGCRIALDDFGTGYSSLSYIASFPLDKLKIDQSFVKRMAGDRQSLAIVETIRALASSLHLEVVAEGIESRTDWDLLSGMGCESGQGYFFGKPLSSDKLMDIVHAAPWIAAA